MTSVIGTRKGTALPRWNDSTDVSYSLLRILALDLPNRPVAEPGVPSPVCQRFIWPELIPKKNISWLHREVKDWEGSVPSLGFKASNLVRLLEWFISSEGQIPNMKPSLTYCGRVTDLRFSHGESRYICKFSLVPLHKGECFQRYHTLKHY